MKKMSWVVLVLALLALLVAPSVSAASGKAATPKLNVFAAASLNNPFVLARAQLALARGKPDAAIAALSEVAPAVNNARLPLAADDLNAQVVRAKAQLSLDETSRAVDTARGALRAIALSPVRDRFQNLEANISLVLGEALQRSGDAAHARPLLERAVQLRESNGGSASPWIGEAEISLANCLLDLGDRGGARTLLQKAEASFVSHSELGAQFKAPAGVLAQRLKTGPVRTIPRAAASPWSGSAHRARRRLPCDR